MVGPKNVPFTEIVVCGMIMEKSKLLIQFLVAGIIVTLFAPIILSSMGISRLSAEECTSK